MIALDTGFLYALVDGDDAWHKRAAAQVASVSEGWITTWPVLTEATHLMTSRLGSRFAQALIADVAAGGILVWDIPRDQFVKIPTMMHKYASLPMDLADASLLLLAEHLGHGKILTTDQRDFSTYRWKNRKPFHNLMA